MRAPTSVTDEPSRMIECSISLPRMVTPSPMAVKGPDVGVLDHGAAANDGRAPHDAARTMRASASITTRPVSSESSTTPSTRGSSVSSTIRFASRMILELPGVLPPALDHVRVDASARGR